MSFSKSQTVDNHHAQDRVRFDSIKLPELDPLKPDQDNDRYEKAEEEDGHVKLIHMSLTDSGEH